MLGVSETFRGKGVLTQLMAYAEKELQNNYEEITINTYPDKFPAMYAYLQKNHFILDKKEWKELHGKKVEKAFFIKHI